MELLAIILLIISAFVHALWNILGKREARPSKEFFLVANSIGCCFLLPILLASYQVILQLPLIIWGLMLLAGLFEAIYFIGLAKNYRAGDISITYPIARSFPIILVIIISIYFFHDRTLTMRLILGGVLVIVGCIMIVMKHFTDFEFKRYFSKMLLSVYLTAVATAGYLLVDNQTLQYLKLLNLSANIIVVAILYSFIRGVFTSWWLLLVVLPKETNRINLAKVLKTRLFQTTLTGMGIYLTYTLVLISMPLMNNISYVTILRQLSIPIAAFIGLYFLHETKYPPKVLGIIIILLGVIIAH